MHFLLDGLLNLRYNTVMPNQPNPEKRVMSFYISREVYYQAKRLAERHGLSLSSMIALILERECRSVELTPEDYESIAREIREARERQR